MHRLISKLQKLNTNVYNSIHLLILIKIHILMYNHGLCCSFMTNLI